MPDVCQLFLPSRFQDVIDERRQVFQTHIFLIEVPILGLLRVKSQMVLSVSGASVISEPDIVALLCEDKGRRILRRVAYPKVHIALDTRHHQYSGLLGLLFSNLAGYPVDLVDVAVLGVQSV